MSRSVPLLYSSNYLEKIKEIIGYVYSLKTKEIIGCIYTINYGIMHQIYVYLYVFYQPEVSKYRSKVPHLL